MAKKKKVTRKKAAELSQTDVEAYMVFWKKTQREKTITWPKEMLNLERALKQNKALWWAIEGWKGEFYRLKETAESLDSSVKTTKQLREAHQATEFWSRHYERSAKKFRGLLVEAQAQVGRLTMQLSRFRPVADIDDKNSELEPVWENTGGVQITRNNEGKAADAPSTMV